MDIVVTREFRKNFKHLSGKYASLRDDLRLLQSQLLENPFMGVELSGGFRKIRLAIRSKAKGKSGGARVITYNVQQTESDVNITLMSIYDKSEIGNVSDTYLRQLVKEIESEKGN